MRYTQKRMYDDIKRCIKKAKTEGIPVLDKNGNVINRIKL